MSEISLLSAILWALASGLIGVGIGVTAMCALFLSKRADESSDTVLRGLPVNPYDKSWNQVLMGLRRPWPSDLAKGKSAKENQ